jgi:predicted porin
MKKSTLRPLMISAVAMAAAMSAQAEMTIGGVFDLGYASTKTPGLTTKKVDGSYSDLSRVVISGDMALNNGVKGIFTVETDFFSPGSGSAVNTSFANGEVQAGLTGGFGTVQAGRVNTATFFNTLFYQPYGTAVGSNFGTYTNGVVRYDNSAKYTTPSLSGFKASLLYSAKNTSGTSAADKTAGVTEVGLSYNSGPLSVGFASLKNDVVGGAAAATGNANADNASLSATKEYTVNSLGASYNLGNGFKAMGLYDAQKADSGTTADRSHTALSGVYATGKYQASATLGAYKDNKAAGSSTASYYSFGYDYFLDSKATSAAYVRYTSTDNKTLAAATAGTYSTVAVGYRFGF